MYRLACPCCRRDETLPRLRRALALYDAQMGEVAQVVFGYLCDEWVQFAHCIDAPSHLAGRAADLIVDEERLLDAITIALACGAVEVGVKRRKNRWILHMVVE